MDANIATATANRNKSTATATNQPQQQQIDADRTDEEISRISVGNSNRFFETASGWHHIGLTPYPTDPCDPRGSV
jgi:hypothetical protein